MRANLAHFQAENLQTVQKMRSWRAATAVNGLKSIGGFRGGAEAPFFFLYFQNVFETLKLHYFASRIRPHRRMLYVVLHSGVGDSAPSF